MEEQPNEILDHQFAARKNRQFPASLLFFFGTIALIILTIIAIYLEDEVVLGKGLGSGKGFGWLGPLLMGSICIVSAIGTLVGIRNIGKDSGFDSNMIGLLGNGLIVAGLILMLIW